MKKICILLLIIICIAKLQSQVWQENIKDPSDFYDIRKAYLDSKNSNKNNQILNSLGADGEEEKFRRWEFMIEPRVYPSGKLPSAGFLLKELNKFKSQNLLLEDAVFQSHWYPLESASGFPQEGYSGRLNCIAFHPLDTNLIFVGSPSGGLWKTTDGGKSWIPKTDNLPSLGVSEIIIDHKNPNIMYMATGDKDAAYFISNPYSYGILKSTDSGDTWDTTGLNHIFADQMTIQRLIIHPTQTNILMAAITGTNGSLRGIWRTTDSGISWKNVSGGAKYDIEFNPTNPDIVYTAGYKYLSRSTDGGITWVVIKSDTLPTTDINYARLSVTPANPNLVFAQYLNPSTGKTYGTYLSRDDGQTWMTVNKFEIDTQGGYDWVFTVSPMDTNIILYGGQNLYGSFDGGKTLRNLPSGHVDHHGLNYQPGTNVLYNCNDGGLYKSYSDGNSWENLNKGLQTFQFYRLGASATNEDMILTGAQDNGVQYHNSLSWFQIGYLADGMECIVDYSDTNIFYISYQYAYMSRYGGFGQFVNPPEAGDHNKYAWVTPYVMHPFNPKILYIGGKDIYKTTNQGNNWIEYSSQLTAKDGVGGGMLRTMVIAESNPDSVLYAASYVVVYRTTDAGKAWNNITSNLPVTAGCFDCSAISYLAVDPNNSDRVWVAMSGYSATNKVFETTDGGTSWQNISENLPAAPVNCIVYQKNSKDILYIGTDLGIFFKDSTDKKWKSFMNDLPNVPVQELEIHYASRTLRAATFGRGLWQSDLYGVVSSIQDDDRNQSDWLYPNPANNFVVLPDKLINKREEISVYSAIGELVYSGNPVKRLDVSYLSPGIYFVKAKARIYKLSIMR